MLTDQDPRQIGRYRLVGRLGQGGQGVVYLAEAPDGTQVAVKVLHQHADARARERFHKEVATARRVAPFCTARILDVGEDGGAPFVVTEYIDGPSLRDLVQRDGPRSGPELYRLAVGTATALAAIHQAGVVHRDFKPGNVLLGPDGPRVIDFGIARSLDLTATATGSVVGTPAYMAPEQFSGRDVGPAADVFAWGATIAYAANGRPPHGQDSVPAVLARLSRGECDLGRLDGPLYRLVRDCLHRDPARRPTSSQVLMRLLECDTPIAADQALAQGRHLAVSAPADDRTARWTALRTTDRPVRAAGRLRAAAVPVAAAAVAVAAIITAVVAVIGSGERGRAGAGSAAGTATPQPTTPAQIATALQRAAAARKTVAFDAKGGLDQGMSMLRADGRCQVDAGLNADCDMHVADEGSHVERTRVVLIGNSGYYGDGTNARVFSVGRGAEISETPMHVGRSTRWLVSPKHSVELVRHAPRLDISRDSASITYGGRLSAGAMRKAPLIGAFYEAYTEEAELSFLLTTSTDHLPQRLELNMVMRYGPDNATRANYVIDYRDWGRAGTVQRPF
ncbi:MULTISPECIES: serine/threonine-protein kinase [Thermomonospora]|uniref:Serine/threonine protein kinase n=1 Tax=Thermomonospora curvata (strain ATCC 19995 / DSM 43183 / JCM 3096 / KCTC 9072 / NBRC 15933 / NCIMB 10081 / Henssen B9) TaxID=471852 RepID=D1A746_THECD|nr:MULTISPECIES: serine/threonine-protein kinase [Thermomonospora]ACZ00252.1 serine/threonine protein kinase [Thermomonospora curvata DSM 43183]PKK12053.1 MAG: serine/threonine protein kinase [Thermomonospora sp. CIF 1]